MDEFGRCELCGLLTSEDDHLCYDCEVATLAALEYQRVDDENEEDPLPLNFHDE